MTRLTNNPVENWIDEFKNNILQGNLAMLSELVGVNYLNLNAKYTIHYQKYENQLGAKLKASIGSVSQILAIVKIVGKNTSNRNHICIYITY